MRILIIGFVTFSIWSAFSTYIYVCKINGLCYESATASIDEIKNPKPIIADSLSKPKTQELLTAPKDLTVYFAFDKFEYTPNEAIDKYFVLSNAFLKQNPQIKLGITGYTDAIGTEEYNMNLGYRRAQSIQKYFIAKGMPTSMIIIDSKGEKKPIDNNNTISGRSKNRRTEIIIKK